MFLSFYCMHSRPETSIDRHVGDKATFGVRPISRRAVHCKWRKLVAIPKLKCGVLSRVDLRCPTAFTIIVV